MADLGVAAMQSELMSEADRTFIRYKDIPWPLLLVDYYFLNKSGGYTDLKSRSEFNEHELFVFNNEIVSRDDLGNIFTGYFAKVVGVPVQVLHLGAGAYQVVGHNSNQYKYNRRNKSAVYIFLYLF